MGAHGGSETIFVDLGFLLGSPGEHFGEHLGAIVSKWSVYFDLCGAFFGASKTGAKKQPKVRPKGAFLEAVDMAEV